MSTRHWYLFLFLALLSFNLQSACGFGLEVGANCYGTYECKPGLFCYQSKCISPSGQACATNSDCPENFACRFQLCVDKTTLQSCSQTTTPCATGFSCVDGFCTKSGEGRTCRRDIDCPTGLVCDVENGSVCRQGNQCVENTDCAEGFICDRDRCIENPNALECVVQDDCSSDEVCSNGVCIVP